MAYTKTTWVDNDTPMSATSLNKIEQGIEDAHKAQEESQTLPFNPTESNESVISNPDNISSTNGLFRAGAKAPLSLFNYADIGIDYANFTIAGAGTTKGANGIHLVQDTILDSVVLPTKLLPNTQYTIVLNVTDKNISSQMFISDDLLAAWTGFNVTDGLNKIVITTKDTITINQLKLTLGNSNIDGEYVDFKLFGIYEGDQTTNPDVDIERAYGLQKCALSYDLWSRGENWWNPNDVELGDIDTLNGTEIIHATRYRTKFIRSKANQELIISNEVRIACYDANKNFIGIASYSSGVWTTLENTYYIRAVSENNNNTMLVVGAVLPSPYVPYVIPTKTEFSTPSDKPLVKLDNGVDNYVDKESGDYKANVKKYVLQSGDINELITTTVNFDYVKIPASVFLNKTSWDSAVEGKVAVSGFPKETGENDGDVSDRIGSFSTGINTFLYLIFENNTYANLAEAQAGLTGTEIYYQLAQEETIKDGQQGYKAPSSIPAYQNGDLVQIGVHTGYYTLDNSNTITLVKDIVLSDITSVFQKYEYGVFELDSTTQELSKIEGVTLGTDGLTITLPSSITGVVWVYGELDRSTYLNHIPTGDIAANINKQVADNTQGIVDLQDKVADEEVIADLVLLNHELKLGEHDTNIDAINAVLPNKSNIGHDHNGTYEPVIITKNSGFNKNKSDSVTSTDSDTLATSAAVKAANDNANTREPAFSKNSGFNLNKSDSITSTSSDTLATSKAVKDVNDKIDTTNTNVTELQNYGSIVTVSASKTLALTDKNKYLRIAGTTVNITVPPNSSVAFPISTEITLFQTTTGTCTVVKGAGVTVNSQNSLLSIDGQYSAITLKKVATDTWDLVGALA